MEQQTQPTPKPEPYTDERFALADAAVEADKAADGWNRRNDARAMALQMDLQAYTGSFA